MSAFQLSQANLPYLVAGSCSLCITCSISAVLVYHLYFDSEHSGIPRWFKAPSLASCLCHTASCVVYILCSLRVDQLYNVMHSTLSTRILFTSLLTLIFAAKIAMYTTFLSRLYLTFLDSVHEIKTHLLRFMVILLSFFIFTVIWFDVLLFFYWYRPDLYFVPLFEGYSFPIQLLAIFAILEVIDLSLNLILVVQFLQKLFLLITARRRTIIERSRLKTATKTTSWRFSIQRTASKTPSEVTTTSNLTAFVGLSVPPPQSPGNSPDLLRTLSLHQIDDQKEIPPLGSSLHLVSSLVSSPMTTPRGNQLPSSPSPRRKQLPSILNENDMVILDAMTKYTILNVLAITVNQVAFTSFSLLGSLYVLNEFYFNESEIGKHAEYLESTAVRMTQIVALFVFPMDAVINCVVLLLHFKFSERLYLGLCQCVHERVQIKYAWKVERKLKGFSKIKEEEQRAHHKSTELTSTTL